MLYMCICIILEKLSDTVYRMYWEIYITKQASFWKTQIKFYKVTLYVMQLES